jgi:hypothetical protein
LAIDPVAGGASVFCDMVLLTNLLLAVPDSVWTASIKLSTGQRRQLRPDRILKL